MLDSDISYFFHYRVIVEQKFLGIDEEMVVVASCEIAVILTF